MTHMLRKQSSMGTPSSSSSGALGLHRDSRAISKVQHQPPKIRIIHIFAPEIIKTDVANFRELVQRLTGKPSPENNSGKPNKGTKKKPKRAAAQPEPERRSSMIGLCDKPTVSTKLEVMMGAVGSPSSSSDHHDQTAWRSSSSSSGDHNHNHNNNNTSGGGYLTAFTDLDFDFNTVWPADCPSHLNAFGDNTQLSFRG